MGSYLPSDDGKLIKGGAQMEMHDLQLMEHAEIYGHNVWHWMDNTIIGEIHIVQYETKDMSIKEEYTRFNSEAEKIFKRFCNRILSGKEF
jgi:hypothetical protein